MKSMLTLLLLMCTPSGRSQTFTLETVNDTLHYLVLTTGSQQDRWRLPYPVYQFQTGDVDGNGTVDALVGVIKKTRFHRELGRRLFILKNYRGHVRPLWMGSKLGGILQDFRYVEPTGADKAGIIRALETTADGQYVVSDYRWDDFGLSFVRFLVKKVPYREARKVFLAGTHEEAGRRQAPLRKH